MQAIDTHILLWGIKRQATPGQEDMVPRAEWLLKDLKARRIPIMVPSVVLSEYLFQTPLDDQDVEADVITSNFFVAPFDTPAAKIAAQIYSSKVIHQIRDKMGIPRQVLHADVKIVATAIAHGAVRIYTLDDHYRDLARGRILVCQVPEVPHKPQELFGEEGIAAP